MDKYAEGTIGMTEFLKIQGDNKGTRFGNKRVKPKDIKNYRQSGNFNIKDMLLNVKHGS